MTWHSELALESLRKRLQSLADAWREDVIDLSAENAASSVEKVISGEDPESEDFWE